MRIVQFLRDVLRTRDGAGFLLAVSLLAITGWLASMPFSPMIQRAMLRRFQMQTASFWLWAAQQPIPAMYNAENRFQISAGGGTPTDRAAAMRHLNHFPFRVFTFGDGRFDYLRQSRPVSLRIDSVYRGRRLETRWQATPRAAGGHEIKLLEVHEE